MNCLLLYHWVRANENAVFEKIESKVDCTHITFFKLNEFKQLIAQKKENDLLSVLTTCKSTLIRTLVIEVWVKENIEKSWKNWM
jgi:hypothetical protein